MKQESGSICTTVLRNSLRYNCMIGRRSPSKASKIPFAPWRLTSLDPDLALAKARRVLQMLGYSLPEHDTLRNCTSCAPSVIFLGTATEDSGRPTLRNRGASGLRHRHR